MMEPRSAIYAGTVVHKRLRPKQHGFSYRVFALCLDIDEIEALAETSRLFRYNRAGLVSFYDRDHGDGSERPIGAQIRATLADAGLAPAGARIELVCYPRLLGYVFNPLSVYFCHEAGGRLGAIVYEVTNTFHERRCYVIPVTGPDATVVSQVCAKELYVSPFTKAHGSYGFHVTAPGDDLVIGVNMREADGPVLKTHFRAERRPFGDASLARAVLRHPMMTAKVIGAIHYEAARLWLKGVRPVKRFKSPSYAVSVINPLPNRALNVQ